MWRRDPLRTRRAHDRPSPPPASTRPGRRSTGCSTGASRSAPELGAEPSFPERNGSQRQRAMIESGASREEVFAASVAETARTYSEGGARVSGPPEPGQQGVPSEDELRAAYEAELARITASDMIAQAAVFPAQHRRATDGATAPPLPAPSPRALRPAPSVTWSRSATRSTQRWRSWGSSSAASPADQLGPLRDALSRLQMAYAAELRRAGARARAATPTPTALTMRAMTAREGPAARRGEGPPPPPPTGGRRRWSRASTAPVRRSPADGSGCPAADPGIERAPVAVRVPAIGLARPPPARK